MPTIVFEYRFFVSNTAQSASLSFFQFSEIPNISNTQVRSLKNASFA